MKLFVFVALCVLHCALVQGFLPTRLVSIRTQRQSSCLQMNMFGRFARVVTSNVNKVLGDLEDPEKILDQSVIDMQNDLVKIRQSYAEIFATQKRSQKQKEAADGLAADWYSRAQLALQKEDEELAKEALSRRQIQVEISEGLVINIERQAVSIEKLYASMTDLDASITDAKREKDALVARVRTAKTSEKVTDLLNNVGSTNSLEAFNRMKEKVEASEARAEVAGELAASSSGSSAGLEERFKVLESGNSVNDELEKMKAEVKGALPAPAKAAQAAQGEAIPMKSELDEEYEKLKKELGQ